VFAFTLHRLIIASGSGIGSTRVIHPDAGTRPDSFPTRQAGSHGLKERY